MVNLIAGRRVVPELIQNDFTAERLANETARLFLCAKATEEMKSDLREVRDKLGPGGAIERAADLLTAML
jgi:lipid-A-disaccharide synthase